MNSISDLLGMVIMFILGYFGIGFLNSQKAKKEDKKNEETIKKIVEKYNNDKPNMDDIYNTVNNKYS